MKITYLKTNHIKNPLGFAIEKPTFTWIVDDTSDTTQTAAQVIVSHDADFDNIIFDSGKLEGQQIDSLGYRPSITLEACTRYFWKVRVWGESEYAESDTAWFETAKLDNDWQAEWITPDCDDNALHPILYRAFELPANVVAACAYVCGLGLYHLELNGAKVSDELFTPYCNAYDQWLQYQTFDVTDQLNSGSNIVSVMLGNGWYKGRYGANRGEVDFYGDRFALLCEIHITLENGDTQIITTDTGWKAQLSPVIFSDIFDGETYDARITKQVTAGDVFGVKPIDIDMTRLEARRSLPVYIMEEIRPIEIIQTPAGETVIDMGQNMTGWVRFKTSAPADTRIHLQFGEVLQDGNFFRDNLRTAKAEYFYIADGTDAVVEPYFTFFGFRYVKVSGWVGDLRIDDFTGCVIYSEMDIIGEIETSNAKVNQLFKNAMWGQKGNFLDIPTDCPQRDERLGWTGDAQIFSGTACFNMDVAAFFSKFTYDLAKEQSKTGGMVPYIVPMVNLDRGGSSAWGDVATIMPWNVYEFYGDAAILEQQFESMRAWVVYIKGVDDASGGHRLWTEGFHFGDWLALDSDNAIEPRKGGTPEEFISSAFYCYSARLVARAATVLGLTDHAASYGQLANEVKAAIQDEYFTATGRLAVPTQTGYVLALFMDLVPEQHLERVRHDFIAKLHRNNDHLQTGFVGTPYLCRVLSNIGANDIAYKLLLNEDFPSWLYAIDLGATTIWERWNSINPDGSISSTGMNSLNHYAYGSIVEWMFRDMCGLNPSVGNDLHTGFRHAQIAPKPDPTLQWARARYESAAGLYESSWRINDTGLVTAEITIPFNTTATVRLLDTQLDAVKVNGHPVVAAEQVDNCVEFVLKTGQHVITYPLQLEAGEQ